MTSVVIAAYNEGAVIERCLDALFGAGGPADLDVTVVANGCTDDTVARATRAGVRVLDLAEPGKANALNAGDRVAVGFPRVYLDADVSISAADLRRVCEVLGGATLVAVPDRKLDTGGRPLLVRAYSAIQARLPVFQEGLFGRGVIAVSETGRARFDKFPELVADDLFLDSCFSSEERVTVSDAVSTVGTPATTRGLVRRLTRVRRGNADLRATEANVRQSSRFSWFTDVVVKRPWLAPAGLCYFGLTVYAALAARRQRPAQSRWQPDREEVAR